MAPQDPGVATVIAAREGDQGALDDLVAGYLPLVYNIVGHALGGHADTDDVVQETMLRALNGLGTLREPSSFRSWLVVIAMNQVRERHRQRPPARVDDAELEYLADPGADFVDLTITRLQLSGERQEVLSATRWLSEEERELLSLWWMETAGRLTRTEVAEAAGLTPQHAAVRIQRMKAQLDTARVVVRAMDQNPRCQELTELMADWDGDPSALWRKRIARHARECRSCSRHSSGLTAVEALVARLPLLPIPAGMATHHTGAGALFGAKPAATGGKFAQVWHAAALKPIAAAVAAVAAVATAVVVLPSADPQPVAQALSAPISSVAPPTTASETPTPSSSTSTPLPPSTSATPTPSKAPVVVPAKQSKKKGVSTWYFDGVTQALGDVGAGWYYNWDSARGQITAPAGVEYVPMIWGAKSTDQANIDRAKQQGKVLLGFNEPDLAEQANMSVEQALDLWPKLQATGLRLGAPSVAFGGDKAGGWLDRFMTGAAQRGLRVDFIPVHWYGSDFSAAAVGHLKNYLAAVHAKFGKPIWLTEYSLIDFSTGTARYPSSDQLAAFATGSASMLETLPYVERYAWFALPADKPGTGLYVNGKTPNAAGIAYRAAGPK